MTIRILTGDCREVLRELADESVHCIVTSPPYWGLRDYGTATWEGGEPGCTHSARRLSDFEGVATDARSRDRIVAQDCKCGARRIDSQLGLEPTYAEYVERMVEVFREVRRVLRGDGTVWLNLGDSYSSNGRANYGFTDPNSKQATHSAIKSVPRREQPSELKAKDLVGIPWRVAFALQADGWYLRQDIIWSKPNPMPESVRDRCTKAHEYIFLLSKSERYYYDATGRNKRSVWKIATHPFPEAHFATFPPALIEPCILAGCPEKCCAKCGAPWVRNTESGETTGKGSKPGKPAHLTPQGYLREGKSRCGDAIKITLNWSPPCSCNASTVPGAVLDPFGGAGTTGLVADRLGRNAILIELNPEYAGMAQRRIQGDAGLFADVVA
jgi:DNA modification methylase